MGREQRRKEAKKVRNNKIARDIKKEDMLKELTFLKKFLPVFKFY